MKAWTAIIGLLLLGVSSVHAATWVSYGYAYDYDYDYLRSDRTSREHRDAGDVDDWIERGNATVTASPLPGFEDGIRLSAWASGDEYDYDFALASAIYSFEIPEQAQYAELKIRYRGDAEESDFEDYEAIAGRVWVRNLNKERTQRSYEEGDEDTLYGDSFVLRARRRSETIKIPTTDHVKDGYMEVHLVVDGSSMLDVEYLDVSTYRRQPEIRVIHRYVRDYDWRPWTSYSYAYFYGGPRYYATDYDYYIMWDWPLRDHRYLAVRRSFQRYLMDYHRRYPRYDYYRPGTRVDVNVDVRVQGNRPVQQRRVRHLAKWTEDHQRTRELYAKGQETRSPSRTVTRPPEVRTRVRSTIQSYREKPVMAERTIRERPSRERIAFGRRRSTPTARSSTSDRLRRTEVGRSILKRRTSTARPNDPERRIRLLPRSSTSRSSSATQQRSRVSPERSRAIESTRERREELEQRIKQRKSSGSSTRSSSSSRVRVKQRSTPPPSAKEDDEDEDEKQQQQQRQRNTERTKRRK